MAHSWSASQLSASNPEACSPLAPQRAVERRAGWPSTPPTASTRCAEELLRFYRRSARFSPRSAPELQHLDCWHPGGSPRGRLSSHSRAVPDSPSAAPLSPKLAPTRMSPRLQSARRAELRSQRLGRTSPAAAAVGGSQQSRSPAKSSGSAASKSSAGERSKPVLRPTPGCLTEDSFGTATPSATANEVDHEEQAVLPARGDLNPWCALSDSLALHTQRSVASWTSTCASTCATSPTCASTRAPTSPASASTGMPSPSSTKSCVTMDWQLLLNAERDLLAKDRQIAALEERVRQLEDSDRVSQAKDQRIAALEHRLSQAEGADGDLEALCRKSERLVEMVAATVANSQSSPAASTADQWSTLTAAHEDCREKLQQIEMLVQRRAKQLSPWDEELQLCRAVRSVCLSTLPRHLTFGA